MSSGHSLGAREMLHNRDLQLPHRVPSTKENMPWCPFLFKNEAYRPAVQFLAHEDWVCCGYDWNVALRVRFSATARENSWSARNKMMNKRI